MVISSSRILRLAVLGVVFVFAAPLPAHAVEKLKLSTVSDYRKCIDQDAPPELCLEALQVFIKSHPAEAFAAGKAVRATMNHSTAIPFFAKTFAKKGDKARCSDEDVSMALVSALALPASYKDLVGPAQLILFDRCWDEAHGAVLAELDKSEGQGALAENLCPKLAERKQASKACDKKPPAAPVAAVEGPKWKELDPSRIAVEEPAKVFKGDEGKKVSLVKVKGTEAAYLIKFDGFRGPWNGRVVLHREQATGSGYDYFTMVNGAPWVSVVARGEGSLFYEAYPSGDKGPFGLFYDEGASKSTTAKSVLDQFAKQSKN